MVHRFPENMIFVSHSEIKFNGKTFEIICDGLPPKRDVHKLKRAESKRSARFCTKIKISREISRAFHENDLQFRVNSRYFAADFNGFFHLPNFCAKPPNYFLAGLFSRCIFINSTASRMISRERSSFV